MKRLIILVAVLAVSAATAILGQTVRSVGDTNELVLLPTPSNLSTNTLVTGDTGVVGDGSISIWTWVEGSGLTADSDHLDSLTRPGTGLFYRQRLAVVGPGVTNIFNNLIVTNLYITTNVFIIQNGYTNQAGLWEQTNGVTRHIDPLPVEIWSQLNFGSATDLGFTNVIYRINNYIVISNQTPYLRLEGTGGTFDISWNLNTANLLASGGNNIALGSPLSTQDVFPGADNTYGLGRRTAYGYYKDLYIKGTNCLTWYDSVPSTNWVGMTTKMLGSKAIFNVVSQTNGVNGPVTGYELMTNGMTVFRIPGICWVDSMVPQTAVRNGSTAPTTAAFNGGPPTVTMFQNNRDDTVEFSVQLNHNYKQGTTIGPHIHWAETAATGAGTGVVWELVYAWANINDAFGAYTTNYVTNAVSGTLWKHQLAELPDITGSGKQISSMLVCQLRRLANSATADDYDQNVAFLGFDIHYQVDSPGSDSELTKSF